MAPEIAPTGAQPRRQKQETNQHAPESPSQCASTDQVHCLPDLDFAILTADHHRSVMKGDEILPLHLYQRLSRLFCTLLRVKS